MKVSRSNRIAVALTFVVAALALGEPTWAQPPSKGGGAILASPARLTKIRLVLGATPDTELSFAPFSVASHLGYWRQEGLDVEVAGLAGMSSSVQALLLGKADIAAVAPDTVLDAADQGRPLAMTQAGQ